MTALIRPTSASEAVQRALYAAGPAGAGILYRLGAGCHSVYDPLPSITGFCDCTRFCCWASGFMPHQDDFEAGHDVYSDAAIEDADHKQSYFVEEQVPQPGYWLVYGSVHRGEPHGRVGHGSIITSVPTGWRHEHGFKALRIVQCAAFHGRAIRETDGAFFDGADSMGRPHNSRILRPTRYVAAPQPAHELVGALLDGLLPAFEAQHGLPGDPDAKARAVAAVKAWAERSA
jgi:hypothetical protein